MLANGKLRTLGEAEAQTRYEFYVPGAVAEVKPLLPDVIEESLERSLPIPFYSMEWKKPKPVKGFDKPEFLKFRTGKTLRTWGKESIYKRLNIIPPPIPYTSSTIPEEEAIPQPPYYFLDGVPNYGQVPFGIGNTFGQSPEGATRGWWGELLSSISLGTQKYLELEKAKYTAVLEEARARQAATTPLPAFEKAGFSTLTIVGLAGAALFMIGGKKVRRKRR